MIPQIGEKRLVNGVLQNGWPSYATLHQATVSFTEMGDRTISTQVRIDGDVVPNFSGWELEFKGERFVLPINDPQAQKDNTTRNSLVDLVFQSWPIQQLKQYFFMSMSEVETGVAIPDQYNAPVVLPVESFVNLFNSVLKYYFGNQISMSLYGMGTGIYSTEPVSVEINYTHIWEVLTKFYELFGLLWRIERDSSTGNYIIKVGYSQPEIDDHDFEYGYNGGLLKFERQVQDENISNILLGRGGEKNLPYRYFKKADPYNPNWAADPDAVPELANIYFDRLRDATFRWYVRGWMQNPNCDQEYAPYPSYDESDIPEYSADDPLKQQLLYAFRRGKTDAKFNPVEYVRDEDSIASYGERWGAVENNDDIYPTIQNMPPWARVDNVIAVSEITTDDIQAASKAAVTENVIDGSIHEVHSFYNEEVFEDTLFSHEFSVPENKIGRLSWDWLLAQNGVTLADWSAYITLDVDPENIRVVDVRSGDEVPTGNIPAGVYRVEIDVKATNLTEQVWNNVRFGLSSLSVIISDIDSDSWKPTFDIWVKNIWGTTKQAGETDEEYSMRVWGPILGDRVGKEARVVFSDGFMAVSEDYEFPIASYPVPDNTKSFQGEQSAWRITLRKSDAEFNTTGLYIPNATTGGKPIAGDHFFFTGIDMPSQYVIWAEEAVCNAKIVKLSETSEINPTWVITLDKVRVHTLEDEDYGTMLADRLSAGCIVHTKDKRFTNNNVLSLRIQSITYNWDEGDIVPNIDVVLADKVLAVTNPIELLSNDMSVVKATYARTSDIEAVVRRVATPMFLKKTGEADRSESPTTFASKVSSDNFRQGDIGGAGWGHYEDGDGGSVLEIDKLVVRKELRVNSLVANQIAYVGGKQINSAANIECTQVIETETGYNCYFDQKGGTVKNLFVVGDFAMGQVFRASDSSIERYYRCRVTEVGDNYITLSKTVKDGSGYPLAGDIIVQYGNDTNVSRRFVIVRDVIGGGYERMISNLSTVSSNGNEYYFAGRQSGSSPRWFVGDAANEYAEWASGRLNIKGTLIVRNSDGTYQAMTDYMAGVANQMSSLQSQIDGQIQSWASGEAPTAQTEPLPKIVEGQVDPSTANFPASGWSTASDREKHIGDIYVDDSTGQGYRYTKRSNNGVTEYYWTRITDEELASALQAIQALQTAVGGLEYLKAALPGSTLVQGGLVLSSLIQLGQVENGAFRVYSGINGILDQTLADPSRSIASWYGGPMVDHELSPSAASYAKSLLRHDGSGYLASGNIHWDALGNGGIPGVSWSGNTITIAGDVRLGSVSGDTVTSMLNLLRQISDWFGEDEDHNIYVKRYNGSTRVFYNDGPVSSGGISTTGGGGGGSVNALRDWANYRPDDTTQVLGSNLGKGLKDDITTLQGYFTNGVADYADDANTLGGHASTYFAHTVRLGSTDYSASNGLINIPSITTGVISDLETWIANKGFVTNAVNDLTNYYLKSQTYTQAEVNALIAAINQFRYEIAASTSAVVNPQPNVLYLIGPIGSGSDRYEEYVYPNATTGWTKIGDTSIDLSGYINSVVASGSGNYITGFSKSGSTLTLSFGTIASWALSANKPSYTFSEIGSKPTTLLGYGITDAYFMARTADADKVGIVLGDTVEDVLIKHQSLSGYVNTVAATAESSVYECSDCDYVYNPANGDPVGGIAPGTAWDDVPSDWVCPICGASKDDFSEGNQFVYNVIKGTNSSTITFGFRRLRLKNIDGTDDLKAIEALTGTSGLLRKTGSNTWSLDTTQYITKDVNNLTNYYTKGQTYTKTEVDARVFFEEYTLPNNGGTAIKLKDAYVGMFASGFVSSGGISTAGGGGGTTVNALRDWANYRPDDTTQVLGSNLGKGLKDSIATLQGYFTNGVANNAANSDTLAGHAPTYYAHQVNLGSTIYAVSNGIVSLPAYPTTLPASDVYTWAKASTKPSYTFSEIGSKPSTLVGYGIADVYFGARTADSDRIPITLGGETQNVLIAHQSLTGYVNNVASSGQEDAYTCPVCGYRYDPSAGDPDAGIAPGTSFADLPTDWECPICQTGKDEFELGGTQYVKAVSKSASSSTIIFTEGRVSLADIDGANSLKGIAYLSGTTGVLKKTGPTTWELDPNAFPTSARELTDADDLCYVDPDEGVSVTIDDPGVTGTVLWGAESANQVALSVNGVSKLLLKAAAIAGIESSISTLSGYFINGSARNALSLGGYSAAYFASASGLTALQEVVAGKQDTINDLATIRTNAGHGQTAYGWGNHASAGYATQTWVNGQLALYPYQIVVNGDAFGSVNGTIELPDYPTTLPASDVYAWAKAATKPSYTFSEIGSKPTTLVGYGITDAYFMPRTADADKVGIVLGDTVENVLIKHQSLSGYAHQVVVNGDAFEAANSVIELPDYPTTLPASDVYAWAKKSALDVNDIPSITTGKISDLETWIGNKGFITKAVNDLTNYYLKSETYTQTEVNNLIAAINQFHYEIYASTSAVTNPQSNVLYLIGPTGSGSDRYEEYVYSNSAWVKIGDTSIDLTGYVNAISTSGTGFVSGVSKAAGSSTISFTFTTIYDWALAASKPSYNFSEIGSKPNTLLGYGISDVHFGSSTADSDTVPITLGGITQNVLTAHQSLTGYVNAIDVGQVAETPVAFVSGVDKQSNSGTIVFDYTNIYSWALAANKPSYNFSEIGSKPTTLLGYGITDAYFMPRTADADKVGIVLGDTVEDVLIKHQSLTGYVNNITQSAPSESGNVYLSGVSKGASSSSIAFTFSRLDLSAIEDAAHIQAIETLAEGSETTGFLKRTGESTWAFDANSYLTGITSAMVTGALGYTPFDAANFTQSVIKSTLGISDWALAASKPSYAFSELSSHPTTLSGYGITDAAAASDLLSYLPLAGGTMTGQLVTPSIKIPGLSTDYAVLESQNGDLLIGDGVGPLFIALTAGNYTSYLYTKADIDTKEGVLAAGIAGNSARLDSIEDWILGVNADTVGLGLVENVALSTWAGSGNITTLGTITTGVWQGTPIAANKLDIDLNWEFGRNSAVYDSEDYVHLN